MGGRRYPGGGSTQFGPFGRGSVDVGFIDAALDASNEIPDAERREVAYGAGTVAARAGAEVYAGGDEATMRDVADAETGDVHGAMLDLARKRREEMGVPVDPPEGFDAQTWREWQDRQDLADQFPDAGAQQ